ncbi:MAG: OmpA family protein, partial [Nitrospiraceae bacterium]
MSKRITTVGLVVLAGMFLISQGCSKKSIQSGGDTQASERGMAKSGGSSGSHSPMAPSTGGFPPSTSGTPGGSGSSGGSSSGGPNGSNDMGSSFPDLSLSSQAQDPLSTQPQDPETSGLKGFDSVAGGKPPSEERLGGGGTMLAKVDPSDSSDRQIEEIRQEQAQEQAASAQAGLNDVFFGYDSWTISEEGRQALMQDAQWIKANGSALVKIEGHCDERGTLAYNLVLGEKRAKAVRNYLVELGVSANRLSVVSYGKERPFCNEHNETCYQLNRR